MSEIENLFFKLFEITYYDCPTPGASVTQTKILIPHAEYLKIKPLPEFKKAIKELSQGREWFTEQSPIFAAITTGYYEGYITRRCKVQLLSDNQLIQQDKTGGNGI